MSFLLKKAADLSICALSHLGCLRPDKEHSHKEFRRQYRVCGEIGAGGFGRVYKFMTAFLPSPRFLAYRLSDGLPVAVKRILHKRVHDWTLAGRRMVPAEISFLEDCQDVKGVVRLVDWFTSRRGFLIVMERPENFMDLFDMVNTFGWLEESMARGIFAQIVDTVAGLYSQHSVIHRDIKDENVVVDVDTGRVSVVDFGAAELFERAKTQQFKGTMSYSPPEVFKRRCYYPLEGTVWSLGILLYILVVGKPPFRNELQICMGTLCFPRSLSLECRSLIRRCLSPTPEGRIGLEELREHAWLKVASDPAMVNFGSEWRRRKRGSLKGGELSEEEEEECSHRTEPGPLTIPQGAATSRLHWSNSHSIVENTESVCWGEEKEDNGDNKVGRSSRQSQQEVDAQTVDVSGQMPQAVAAEVHSSAAFSSSSSSESGFETALGEDDDEAAGDSVPGDAGGAWDDEWRWSLAREHQRRFGGATAFAPCDWLSLPAPQSDSESARASPKCRRRRNSFISVVSTTTYFSASSSNKHGPFDNETASPSSYSLTSESGEDEEAAEEEEEELTLRAERDEAEEEDERTIRVEFSHGRKKGKGRMAEFTISGLREEEDEDDDGVGVGVMASWWMWMEEQKDEEEQTGDEDDAASSSPAASPSSCSGEGGHHVAGGVHPGAPLSVDRPRRGGVRYRRRRKAAGTGSRRRFTSPPQQQLAIFAVTERTKLPEGESSDFDPFD